MMFFLLLICFNMFMYLYNNMKFLLSNFITLFNVFLLIKFDFFVDWVSLEFMFGMNIYSYGLFFLSIMVVSFILMIINMKFYEKFCIILFNLLLIVLMMIFMSIDFMSFYFYYEVSLILTFLIIIYWGVGVLRLMSGYYFMFYTLFFSLPLLMFMYYIIFMFNTNEFFYIEIINKNLNLNMFMFMYLLLSFFVKIPMYMLHGWLLKAHVEAPVFGSMILASILLKMGTYGLIRIMFMFVYKFMKLKNFLMIFSLLGSIIISIVCIRQIDMKILVAYSSVVHMGMLLCGMMTYFKLGFLGSYMMMIAHGLCSSGLFYLVNVCYLESNSRLMMINKGLMMFMPSMSLIWFLMCSSNMSAPVSLNLISELMLMMSLVMFNKLNILLLMVLCLFSFLYSLYLFSYVQHGKMNYYLNMKSGILKDFFILLMHWFPLNILFLNMFLFNF